MKLPDGTRVLDITTGGVTKVVALVTNGGNNLNIGAETYHWSDADGEYVADHVPATFDPHPDGTLHGVSGIPPNAHLYGGTWH